MKSAHLHSFAYTRPIGFEGGEQRSDTSKEGERE